MKKFKFIKCRYIRSILSTDLRVVAKLGGQLLLIFRIFSQKRQNAGTPFSTYNHSIDLKLVLLHSSGFELCTRTSFIYFRVCLHCRNGTAVFYVSSPFLKKYQNKPLLQKEFFPVAQCTMKFAPYIFACLRNYCNYILLVYFFKSSFLTVLK